MNLSRRFWVKNFVDFSHAQSQTKFTRVPFHPTVGLRAAPCVLCIVAIFSVSSASSIKAGYGLPTAATLTTLDTLERMRTWCRCSVQTWQAVDTHLGKVPDATLLAMLPASSLKGGPSDLGHVRHRSSCRSCSASASSGTRQSSSYFEQKDQGRFDVQDRDRSNSFVPCSDDWGRAGRRMRTNWRTTCIHAGPHCQKGGVPLFRLQHSDPLQSDNAEAAEDLVADATGWNIQGAGRATPSFDSWKACWKVFRSILLMLRYPAAKSNQRAPQGRDAKSRGIFRADQQIERRLSRNMASHDESRRQMSIRDVQALSAPFDQGSGLPMGLEFSPNQPWIGVFTYAKQSPRSQRLGVLRNTRENGASSRSPTAKGRNFVSNGPRPKKVKQQWRARSHARTIVLTTARCASEGIPTPNAHIEKVVVEKARGSQDSRPDANVALFFWNCCRKGRLDAKCGAKMRGVGRW